MSESTLSDRDDGATADRDDVATDRDDGGTDRDGAGPTTNDRVTFRATIDADTLESALAPALALFEECHLRFGEDGLALSAIDAATVAWVELELSREAFEAFEATAGHVGIDLSRLADVVGMAGSGGSVRLAFDSGTRRLRVRIGDLAYDLATLDPDSIRSPPDDIDALDAGGRVVAGAADVDRAVRAAAMVSDHVELAVDADAEVFAVEADGDTDDVSLALSAGDLPEFAHGEARSLYSVDYLESIVRATPRDADLELRLGVEQPLSMRYAFAHGDGTVRYLVAPRIAAN